MASAILTLFDPRNYGVLDIRVWRLLHGMKLVDANPGGKGFTSRNWCQYLGLIRSLASKFRVSVRTIDRILFRYHRKVQVGELYAKERTRRRAPERVQASTE
jgi:hypothetical protein